jgi:chromosome segregation ATPase
VSKEILVDKYGNEFVKIEVKYNNKAQSIVMNDWRIGGCKWNDVDNGKFLTLLVNKKDLMNELGANKQIADLEAKLAESEEEKQEYLIKYKHWRTECAKLEEQLNNSEQKCLICSKDQENEQLKQQLAEKEKEIEKNETTISALRNSVYIDMLNIEMLELRELNRNQDKISFAVEQLEKVKEWVKKRFEEISCIYEEDATEYIDNQIKQLTRQHEDKGSTNGQN